MQALAQTLANKTQDAAIVRELVMDIRGRELRTVQLGRTARTIQKFAVFADVLAFTSAASEQTNRFLCVATATILETRVAICFAKFSRLDVALFLHTIQAANIFAVAEIVIQSCGVEMRRGLRCTANRTDYFLAILAIDLLGAEAQMLFPVLASGAILNATTNVAAVSLVSLHVFQLDATIIFEWPPLLAICAEQALTNVAFPRYSCWHRCALPWICFQTVSRSNDLTMRAASPSAQRHNFRQDLGSCVNTERSCWLHELWAPAEKAMRATKMLLERVLHDFFGVRVGLCSLEFCNRFLFGEAPQQLPHKDVGCQWWPPSEQRWRKVLHHPEGFPGIWCGRASHKQRSAIPQ